MRAPSSRRAFGSAWLPALAATIAAAAAACSSGGDTESSPSGAAATTSGGFGGSGGTGGSGAGAAGGDGPASTAQSGSGGSEPELTPREFFEKHVQPGLDANCKVCHATGGVADFLAPPDEYASITTYKSGITDQPIVWPIPEQSILVTYPDSGDHHGTPYEPTLVDLRDAVVAWLTKEAASLPDPGDAGPIDYIVPFKPVLGGLNAVYLNPLGPEYENSAITFFAVEMGNPPTLLQLWSLSVYPASKTTLRVVHPRFSVYPPESETGEPDPVDSLSEVDQTFIWQSNPILGPGEVILVNWQKDARLAIDFDEGMLEATVENDGGISVPCKSTALYQQAVESLGPKGPMYCAQNCHGGNKPQAKGAMDLSGLLARPPDYEAACAAMRARITPGDPESSQILIVTNPTQVQVVHMYKFAGNLADYNSFKAKMSPWILAE